ncbi:hypothetical protein C8A05DRAFT_17818 [Staphylotrichum tortipilum]|uniref:Rho-GAP domain-containing protein n=1 Tax=Staphylotrichum tortipilum TaxID=2831512 RepID=A0AAN6MF91_9PEZI|nr:hypothetical protein C8A05DRAFT_17818 [Staphylotrichum longicolle]
MSAILETGLREQLAAALLGWGWGGGGEGEEAKGPDGGRASNDTIIAPIDSPVDGAGRETPKPSPRLGLRRGYGYGPTNRGVIEYTPQDDTDSFQIDDDIDADWDIDSGLESGLDTSGASVDGRLHALQPRRTTERTYPAPQKTLPPLPFESPRPPPPVPVSVPDMSCRLSRFPFAHPCDVPDLMPDHDDLFGTTTSPSVSGPATPSVVPDLFRPLTESASPDLDLTLMMPKQAAELELHPRARRMSTKSAASELSEGGLGVIREEDDANTDGVSLLTPTEASGESGQHPRGDRPGHWRSVSSLGSGSSGEWRPSNASAGARKSSIFSRIRGGRPGEDEFFEKRSLTPVQLSPSRQGNYGDEPLSPAATPTSPSFSHHLRPDPPTTTSSTSKFFHRMTWLGDSQPKKPEAVFGVELKESIRVAPMKIRISHKGRSTSYRTYPLSVYKCCEFIRRAGGTDGYIFSLPGHTYNVAHLKTVFSLAPTYGDDFQFEGSDYTVHDAARLILIYLEELPKPLIPPSVVKSWILLARQEGAIEPPCPRIETGLDFWTEALNRLPTASRNLTKHLLTLFAEVLLAASGQVTEADARQLASSVSRAMFHQDVEPVVAGTGTGGGGLMGRKKSASGKRNVQPTLALAFLIKKRGEYAVSLGEASGKGANKRDSKMFLPSTREMMEWKGGQ